MPQRYQKLLAIVLIGLMGLSPVLASVAVERVALDALDARHCMQHKTGHCLHHGQGQEQCKHHGLCAMGHCSSQTMTSTSLTTQSTLLLAGLHSPLLEQVPTSIDPSALYRPPQA